jgi:superfamily II RNA helicase
MNNAQAANNKQVSELETKIKEYEKALAKISEERAKERASYQEQCKKKDERIFELEKQNQILEEKLKLALYRQFGRHAERFEGEGQPLLFDAGEGAAPEEKPEEKKVHVAAHERSRKGRKAIDPRIPRVRVDIDVNEEDKQCACGGDWCALGKR